MERNFIDRSDIPIDYRYMGLLLNAAKDPDVGLGDFAAGVRAGLGPRLPRVPALYPPKRKWRLLKLLDPFDYLEEQSTSESVWRQNCSSLEEYEEQVLEVMIDQAKRGQVLRLSEAAPDVLRKSNLEGRHCHLPSVAKRPGVITNFMM